MSESTLLYNFTTPYWCPKEGKTTRQLHTTPTEVEAPRDLTVPISAEVPHHREGVYPGRDRRTRS